MSAKRVIRRLLLPRSRYHLYYFHDASSALVVEWRKRFAGTGTFDMERFHLRQQPDGVDLEIDMPWTTWDAFTS